MTEKSIKEVLDYQIPEEYLVGYTQKEKERLNMEIFVIVLKNIEQRLFGGLTEEKKEEYNSLDENKQPQEYLKYLIENSENPVRALEQIGEEMFSIREKIIDLTK